MLTRRGLLGGVMAALAGVLGVRVPSVNGNPWEIPDDWLQPGKMPFAWYRVRRRAKRKLPSGYNPLIARKIGLPPFTEEEWRDLAGLPSQPTEVEGMWVLNTR